MFEGIFTLNYWFNANPSNVSKTGLIFLVAFFTLFFLAEIIMRVIYISKRKKFDRLTKKIISRLEVGFLTFGSLGLIWTFLAYENIPILGVRFWLIIGLVIVLWWAYYIYRFAFIVVPEKRALFASKQNFEKYLPNKKR